MKCNIILKREMSIFLTVAAEAISWAKKASSLLPLTSVDTHGES